MTPYYETKLGKLYHGGKKMYYPTITINGSQVRLHRHVMARHIGRELLSSELVHHINKDVTDNRIENLQLTDRPNHKLTHGDIGKNTRFKHKHHLSDTRLCRLYCDFKMSIHEIAKFLNISPMTIHRNMVSYKIKRRSKSDAAKLKKI